MNLIRASEILHGLTASEKFNAMPAQVTTIEDGKEYGGWELFALAGVHMLGMLKQCTTKTELLCAVRHFWEQYDAKLLDLGPIGPDGSNRLDRETGRLLDRLLAWYQGKAAASWN